MGRLILPALGLLLAVAAAALFWASPLLLLLLLHGRREFSWPLLLARFAPLAATSLAALPLGALGAAGLARAPRVLRLFGGFLLGLAVLGAGWGRGLPQATLAPLLGSVSIVMLILVPRFEGLDRVVLEAAAASGASPWDRLWLVVLPWIRGACLAAFLFCLVADAGLWVVPLDAGK